MLLTHLNTELRNMMTKYIFGIFIAATLFSCTQKNNTSDKGPVETMDTLSESIKTDTLNVVKPISEKQLISPGKGIGQLRIDARMADAYRILGKPDSGDNAMGSSLAVWYADHKANGYATSVFGSHKYGAKNEQVIYIKKIMVNSPWFKTAEGLGTGSSIERIKKQYAVKKGESFKVKNKTIHVYSDLVNGITFEVDSETSKCSSIIVGRPNEADGTYLNMH